MREETAGRGCLNFWIDGRGGLVAAHGRRWEGCPGKAGAVSGPVTPDDLRATAVRQGLPGQ